MSVFYATARKKRVLLNITNNTNIFKSIHIRLMSYLSALILFFVYIVEAHSAERQLDAHAHGYGKLNVAIDGPKVALELNSPAFNIVGFEHSPETDKDKATIKNALSILNDGSGLFLFPAVAGCRLANVNVVSSLTEAQHSVHKEHDSDHKEHDSDHKEHDSDHKDQASDHKEHDSDHKDQASDHKEHDSEHKTSKHEDHSNNDIHSEFHANYQFQCDVIEKVNTIQVMIFKHFPNTRQLNVQMILPNRQSAMELTPTSTLLSF
jgi:hypothetical protein